MERTGLLIALLGLLVGPASARWFSPSVTEDQQVQMLKRVVSAPLPKWKEELRAERELLDESFFIRTERRMQRGFDNGHIDDAIRFATIGDLAAQVVGRPGNFREKLLQFLGVEGRRNLPITPLFIQEAPPGFDFLVPEEGCDESDG